MKEGLPEPEKSKEELEKEFEQIEDSVIELTLSLEETILDDRREIIYGLEERFRELAKKMEDEEVSLAEAIKEAKDILDQLEAFTS
jgi:hypothetical protein